jgi:hypothetical protein
MSHKIYLVRFNKPLSHAGSADDGFNTSYEVQPWPLLHYKSFVHFVQLATHDSGLCLQGCDLSVGLAECRDGIRVLLGGGCPSITKRFSGVRVALDDAPSGNRGGEYECSDSSVFPLLSGVLVCICLIISSLMCSRHAVYNCSYSNDSRYCIL